jgi:hypothetical protein
MFTIKKFGQIDLCKTIGPHHEKAEGRGKMLTNIRTYY